MIIYVKYVVQKAFELKFVKRLYFIASLSCICWLTVTEPVSLSLNQSAKSKFSSGWKFCHFL